MGHTLLTDSNQAGGGDSLTPDGVLEYSGVVDRVLDRIILASSSSTPFSSALVIRDDSSLLVNDAYLVASDMDTVGSAAVSVVNNSGVTPGFSDSVVLGKMGGTETSRGFYLNNARLDISGSAVYSGEASTGGSVGIQAEAGSFISANWSVILGGNGINVDNGSIVDSITDGSVFGMELTNSNANVHDVLIRAADAVVTGNSIAFQSSSASASFINASTLVSGGGAMSVALDCNGIPVNLYNSVLLSNTGTGSADSSYGIRLAGMAGSEILNNAIYSRRATSETAGIRFLSTGSVDIINNLIWTDNLTDFPAILSPASVIATNIIQNNNIWSTGENAGMNVGIDLGSGVTYYDLGVVQDTLATITGNVSLEMNVNTALNISDYFGSSHFSIGRAQTPIPEDVRFGGRDESGNVVFPDDGVEKKDREWNSRFGYSFVGWSMGPYEFEDTASPHLIYVSDGAQANDNHPLGTREAPFSTLTRAYDIARFVNGGRWEVTEIRMKSGDFDVGKQRSYCTADDRRHPDYRGLEFIVQQQDSRSDNSVPG